MKKIPNKRYVAREFQRFVNAVGFRNEDQLIAAVSEMKKTAQALGMSDEKIATIYDADELLEIYRETLKRRH